MVVGWNVAPSIGEAITALNDSRLEVLVIPSDLMDKLKKKGGIDTLHGQVRCSSLQYMTIHPVQRSHIGVEASEESLTVRLKNYVLLAPEAINLDTANDGDALRVVTQAVLTVPFQAGSRRVCMRVVDVFGFEAKVAATEAA